MEDDDYTAVKIMVDAQVHSKVSDMAGQIEEVLVDGLEADGAHHKQWALWEIGRLLQIDLRGVDAEPGVKP